MIFKAIGQTFIDVNGGTLELDGRTSAASTKNAAPRSRHLGRRRLCWRAGKDLTVAAVDDGRRAAESIHAYLSA
jgi:NADPH-dependent glutamate synthase beta subunit-like oxidoreductase